MYNVYDEVLEYAEIIAKKFITPKFYYADGEEGGLMWENAMWQFVKRLNDKTIDFVSKKGAFEDNESIVLTVEGYEMGIEQFWYATIFIYDYMTQTCTVKGTTQFPSASQYFEDIYNYLSENPKSEIIIRKPNAKKKDTLIIPGKSSTGEYLIKAIDKYINSIEGDDTMESNKFISYPISFNEIAESEIASVQMCMVVKMYKVLFEALNLPDKQAKYNRHSSDGVSYNKMLLISRICYFYGLTQNSSYTVDDDVLKKIFNEYKDVEVTVPLSSVYMLG